MFLEKKKRRLKHRRSRMCLLGKAPQRKGTCTKVYDESPKKPNSARRKLARVILTFSGKGATAYIPGIGHNLQKFSSVLVRGGRVKDMPGINFKIIRGIYDCQPVLARMQGRSKYGTKSKLIGQPQEKK